MEVGDKTEEEHTVCGMCAMGRQHKEAGTKTQEKATEILAVVPSGICAQMQTLINSCGQILIVCIKVYGENSIKLISASSLT